MKKNGLILCFFLTILVTLSVIYIVYVKHINSSNKDIKYTYSTIYSVNAYGQFFDTSEVSEEQFDNYGNLTHYKFNHQDYNYNYDFDNNDRITKVIDNTGNSIEIKYTNSSKISEIVRKFDNQEEIYSFTYSNNSTLINKKIISLISEDQIDLYELSISDENNQIITQKALETSNNAITPFSEKTYSCVIKDFIYDNEKYIIYQEIDNASGELISEFLCKKLDKAINYNNLHDLLNLNYPGYIQISNSIRNEFTGGFYPVFNCGQTIYLKNTLGISSNFYYDNNNRDLMYAENNNPSLYYVYDERKGNEYTGTAIKVVNTSKFTNSSSLKYYYITFKDYLSANGEITKRELSSNEISKEEYDEKLPSYQNYFESNKTNIPKNDY